MKRVSKEELKEIIKKRNDTELNEKVNRLWFLVSNTSEELFPTPILAFHYFEEARLCYLHGAFIATIFMVHNAFEELLRSFYRVIRGQKEKIISKRRSVNVDDATFKELIDDAENERFITKEEARSLHKLRRLRNKLQHTKDVPPYQKSLGDSWVIQSMRVESRVEKDARWAIKFLLNRFPSMCKRLF